MVNEKYSKNLAKTAVKIGVNIQPDQFLVINSPIETADFAREIARAAFNAGARDVYIDWKDEKFSQIRISRASEESLEEVPDWWTSKLEEYIDKGAAVITISAKDPDLMEMVDNERIDTNKKALNLASTDYHKALMENKNRWCVISVPTAGWARKVFPEARNKQQAIDLLWNAIFRSTRCNEKDPIEFWKNKDSDFKKKAQWLNEQRFDKLHITTELGTDVTIGLPEDHLWSGGSEIAQDGIEFFPNLPTEEIYTAPDKNRIDGHVVASYPLDHEGKIIDKFAVDFKDGKVIDFCARKNEDLLAKLLKEEGADSLGEIALVPYDSPISDMNLLFYNTLFDENAACHMAFGDAYPTSIKDGTEYSEEELAEKGLNRSKIHTDFMFGTKDTNITGITKDGRELPIFVNGNFAF